ncbi:glycosyltransferase [Devosia sp. Naph2]|uniref:glycosyltransferase n=1 Tax=Devosia polycyclovorans TaxID=3345148 RepID=UPI0035CF1423
MDYQPMQSESTLPAEALGLERTAKGPLVLLFYDGFDHKARRGWIGRTYSAAHRFARRFNNLRRRKQMHSGFYAAFLSLQRSLHLLGCDVRVNDFEAAEARPGYPVGLCGYPSVLDVLASDNPAIFGHGDVGPSERARQVAEQQRLCLIIQPCAWAVEYNRPIWGDRLRAWPVGIEAPKLADVLKDLDFVVYDKIRWHREERETTVRDALLAKLDAAGLKYEVLRYGAHMETDYLALLARSRGLLFLCEHETQGIACQLAMAAGVPVLAWDEGRLVDPTLLREAPDLIVTSVPYFDDRCGLRFKLADFDRALSSYLANRANYDPASYVAENLSMRKSGEEYLRMYASLSGSQPRLRPAGETP